jgi:hypothetical protein
MYACAFYPFFQSDHAAALANCRENDGYGVGINKEYAFLTCQIVNGQFSCTAPATLCAIVAGSYNCVTSSETGLDLFYVPDEATEDASLFISTGSPSGYTSIRLTIHDI